VQNLPRDWLLELLTACSDRFDGAAAVARLETFRAQRPALADGERIRRFFEQRLRETGLVYGTPLGDASQLQAAVAGEGRGVALRRAVFLALLKVQVELAMEVGCAIGHCSQGNVRTLELATCLAMLCGRLCLAERLHVAHRSVPEGGPLPGLLRHRLRRLGRALTRRAYLAGNPLLGLPIQNSLAYVDAKTLGRLAVVYFERGRVDRPAARRVLAFHDQEREMLLLAQVGLALADRPVEHATRAVMREQLRAARLPRRTRRELDQLLERPVRPLEVAAAAHDDRARDFLLEQVLLGAILDGHFSQRERDYIADLAGWLGVGPAELVRREAEVVAFYESHRELLDVFTVAGAVLLHRERMLGRLQRAIGENTGLIVQEIRRTGDLAELLVRAASGERLPAEDWRRVRARLLDVVRNIPALAIFSLPGGAVLLPLVFRMLPDGLKPRAFAERDRRLRQGGGREGSQSGAQP
jgi:hypothetical protein